MESFILKLKENVDAFEGANLDAGTDITKLEDWDSVALLSVMGMISSEYGVNLTSTDIVNAATVENIFNLVNSKK